MSGYASAASAYKELRAAIDPWAKAQGFRRRPKIKAGWQKALPNGRRLVFHFEGYSLANPDIGNAWTSLVDLETAAQPPDIIRQAPLSCCLIRAELDELAAVQGAINRRRPPLPEYLSEDAAQDSLLGHYLRGLYDAAPAYREGEVVSLAYFSLQDVRALASFTAGVLPAALDRFLEGKIAKPVDTTPPHLKSRWLEELG